MLKVLFEYDKTQGRICLQLKGHAGMARQDIVCAAATILAYTIGQVVSDMHKMQKLAADPTIKIQEGDAYICCIPSDASLAEALHRFFVVETGYRLLAHHYPQYLRLQSFDKG